MGDSYNYHWLLSKDETCTAKLIAILVSFPPLVQEGPPSSKLLPHRTIFIYPTVRIVKKRFPIIKSHI